MGAIAAVKETITEGKRDDSWQKSNGSSCLLNQSGHF